MTLGNIRMGIWAIDFVQLTTCTADKFFNGNLQINMFYSCILGSILYVPRMLEPRYFTIKSHDWVTITLSDLVLSVKLMECDSLDQFFSICLYLFKQVPGVRKHGGVLPFIICFPCFEFLSYPSVANWPPAPLTNDFLELSWDGDFAVIRRRFLYMDFKLDFFSFQ